MIDAILLLQDVQLLCFTVIFFFVSRQHPNDRVRRWLWYSFVANAAGAVLDFAQPHLPAWIGRGLNLETIPLSYALLTLAFAYFLRRHKVVVWISFAVLLAALPNLLLWSGRATHVPGDSLVDLVLAVQTLVLAVLLPLSREEATRSPRWLMAGFFLVFSVIEFARAYVAFGLKLDPDVYPSKLGFISSVAYVVSTSVLPLGFIWMMNSRLESDLVQQNMLVPLTQVLNRRGLRRVLEREMLRQKETGYAFSVAMMDLDHFKQLNDTFGHANGDAMLVGIADLLEDAVRDEDSVARIGGEEFVLVLPRTDEAQAAALLERLREQTQRFAQWADAGEMRLTASFGATTMRAESSLEANDLLREADVALYRAKQEGRNRVRFFRPDDDGERASQTRAYLG